MAATTTARERELDALASQLIEAEEIASSEAHAEAEDQLSELMAYATDWDGRVRHMARPAKKRPASKRR